jgi:hypothetical protein
LTCALSVFLCALAGDNSPDERIRARRCAAPAIDWRKTPISIYACPITWRDVRSLGVMSNHLACSRTEWWHNSSCAPQGRRPRKSKRIHDSNTDRGALSCRRIVWSCDFLSAHPAGSLPLPYPDDAQRWRAGIFGSRCRHADAGFTLEDDVVRHGIVAGHEPQNKRMGLDPQDAGPKQVAVRWDTTSSVLDLRNKGVILGTHQFGELSLGQAASLPQLAEPVSPAPDRAGVPRRGARNVVCANQRRRVRLAVCASCGRNISFRFLA